jgi:hypothetical protein
MWISDRTARHVLVSMLVAALLSAGCGLRALDEMKEDHRQGQYTEVAAMDVSCDPGDDRCNQMHLLKGDACYVLGRRAESADEDSTARARFACAETHLGEGLRQTEPGSGDWAIAGNDRAQWYTNRAESLRQLQDLLAGDSARTVSRRLLEFGRTYRETIPDAAAPHFYIATARYALLQPRLLDAPSGDADVCGELDTIISTLDEAPPAPDTSSVHTNIESLRRQLDRQRSRLDCSS